MTRRLKNVLVDFWIVLVFGLAAALLMPQAHAGMIGTETSHAQDERARVKALLERPDLALDLEKRGIAPRELSHSYRKMPSVSSGAMSRYIGSRISRTYCSRVSAFSGISAPAMEGISSALSA